ncbi:dolichyl-phosphate beta-D-mannosyltransferase [Candidatus Kuenenbacteria bacterium CG_4_9_14_3_um_filter_39_14]|uniref:Dolichyl-phosphate beta-D-mannosyltransferase n=2 Tax=Candidatus Kueneniibacteriota TaxID=1752740 RepID=A0A2M7Z9W3_9BACT|nr:MAG: hypothetical protein AUK13_00720 [Candidatus Kuenenbacteria bacterium CG2_30_39_24]PJA92329.1 MAG: dolichyl-phosphate beta-D-mannosyltransferase [Candidatus Kuenenbacteria bacterium CG_4_9_14_3_um_filter_39_14]
MKKYIILPTYNEAENLSRLVREISSLNIPDLNIIAVDDGSPDGTGQIADRLAKEFPLIVIHRQGKQGLGSACITGFKKALEFGADIVCQMDADFSHDPHDLPRLLERIDKDYDFVIGSRRVTGGNIKGWSRYRNIQSILAMSFARAMLGLKTRDITAGYRCLKATMLKDIDFQTIKANGYAFQEELIYRSEKKGYSIAEVPVTFIDRKFGQSKLGIKDIIEFFMTVFRLRLKK